MFILYGYIEGLCSNVTENVLYSLRRGEKLSWILFQEGWNSELKLRWGVEQAAHTLNNPHVECTGVLLYVIRQ
jgi:hypothetical protein